MVLAPPTKMGVIGTLSQVNGRVKEDWSQRFAAGRPAKSHLAAASVGDADFGRGGRSGADTRGHGEKGKAQQKGQRSPQ